MVKNNEKLVKDIVDAVGGPNNIRSSTNCMTRVRMDIKDRSKIDRATLENVEGVMGVNDADSYQVIVGPGTARKVNDLLVEKYNVAGHTDQTDTSVDWQDTKQDIKDKQSQEK